MSHRAGMSEPDFTKEELLGWAKGDRPDLEKPMSTAALRRVLLELEATAAKLRAILEAMNV